MKIDRRMVMAVLTSLSMARSAAVEAQGERVATAWAFAMARLRRVYG